MHSSVPALLPVTTRVKPAKPHSSPHGEQAIYAGSELLSVITWRAGFSHVYLATGRRLGKFRRPNDAMTAICSAAREILTTGAP
jgi:hypothetical protein